MAPTRFYLPSSGAAAVSPAFSAEWDDTASAVRRACVTALSNTASAGSTVTDTTATSDRDALVCQYVSAALSGGGTLSGTLKGQIRAGESGATHNLRAQILVKFVSNDGNTLRGVAYAGDLATLTGDPSSEFDASGQVNRKFPRGGAASLAAVSYQANDRVVLEIGYRKHAAAITSGTLIFGDTIAAFSDLPEDETTTTGTTRPWLEFSIDLNNPPAPPTPSTGLLFLGSAKGLQIPLPTIFSLG